MATSRSQYQFKMSQLAAEVLIFSAALLVFTLVLCGIVLIVHFTLGIVT